MSTSLSPFWSAFKADGSFSQQLLVELPTLVLRKASTKTICSGTP
jgi:hypothetical protein